MKKILVVANPTSGSKFGLNTAELLLDLFDKKNIEANLYETTGEDDFRQLTLEALETGYDTFAILGGDGTISEFVSKISALDERPNILLIPTGTTNNFAQALETEMNVDRLLLKIEQNELVKKQTDVGQVNDEYFISTLSAGSVPEMAWRTDERLKEVFGSFGYVLKGISVANEDKQFDITIQTPREDITVTDVKLLIVGLSNSVFGIPSFFDNGAVNDGKLQLYILKSSTLIEEAKSITQHIMPMNRKSNSEDDTLSFTMSFKKASLQASGNLNLAKDGEKGPKFPVEVGILDNHLTFIVAESDK